PDLLGPALGGLLDALDSAHVGEMARALVEAHAALAGDWSAERAAPAREPVRALHGHTPTALPAGRTRSTITGRQHIITRPTRSAASAVRVFPCSSRTRSRAGAARSPDQSP
ncbi:hypothetical protein VM98_36640, partial [Streptomyces rubellomurinus subsp. indigoferus]